MQSSMSYLSKLKPCKKKIMYTKNTLREVAGTVYQTCNWSCVINFNNHSDERSNVFEPALFLSIAGLG